MKPEDEPIPQHLKKYVALGVEVERLVKSDLDVQNIGAHVLGYYRFINECIKDAKAA